MIQAYNVKGWIVDYRTAAKIFETSNNSQIAHLVGLCATAALFICHCEEARFRQNARLRPAFIDENCCVVEPNREIMSKCETIASSPNGKRLLPSDDASIYITAVALTRQLGVISDHRSAVFPTVYDLCCTYGVPVLSAVEYFASP